ncbi:hypothetical protein EYF80_066803 [Liparis tanakae]|uniref:Uncharacterized protein n=1 Tax=Liparis tanakae TaxID=230148 RepID=A0A4Z2E3F4_9TELE|nr:hypothetical protein EYF80_066803 [Liparis tanakae]
MTFHLLKCFRFGILSFDLTENPKIFLVIVNNICLWIFPFQDVPSIKCKKSADTLYIFVYI